MSLDIDDLKNWLRIDHSEDDLLLQGMAIACEQMIQGAIGFVPTSELGNVAKRMVIADWYENRQSFLQGNAVELPFGARMILTQLKYTGDPA